MSSLGESTWRADWIAHFPSRNNWKAPRKFPWPNPIFWHNECVCACFYTSLTLHRVICQLVVSGQREETWASGGGARSLRNGTFLGKGKKACKALEKIQTYNLRRECPAFWPFGHSVPKSVTIINSDDKINNAWPKTASYKWSIVKIIQSLRH